MMMDEMVITAPVPAEVEDDHNALAGDPALIGLRRGPWPKCAPSTSVWEGVDGERVLTERVRRGWTRAELARQAGVSASAVSRAEGRWRSGPETIRKLAACFDLPVEALLWLGQRPRVVRAKPRKESESCAACAPHSAT